MLLNDRNLFRRHLDAQVAASDHHTIGSFQDFFQVIDGLRLLQFGDQGSVAALADHDLLDHVHVGGGAHEGERNRVHTVFEAELEILAIFFGHGGDRQRGAGQIDALMLAQSSTVQDVADHILAADGAHAQFDETVAQKNARAGGDLAGEIGEGGGNARGRAGEVARGNHHGRAAFSRTGSWPSRRPVRILGPCKSCRMQTVRSSFSAARRKRSMLRA